MLEAKNCANAPCGVAGKPSTLTLRSLMCPASRTYAECRRVRRHLDAPAGRSYWAPLKQKADVTGYATAAHRREHRLGRAGAGRTPDRTTSDPDRRTLRRNTGRIRDALMRRSPFLPTPALLPGRKVRLRLSPHFSAFPQPYGLKQKRSVPPALPAAAGSSRKPNVLVAQWPRCLAPPRQAGAPSGTALLAESGRCLQVFGSVRTPQAALLV